MKTKKEESIITYKGFDKDLKCRDFQYEVGKEYEIKDKPIRCTEHGFHSCINPLDIFSYYDPNSRFAECESSGSIDRSDDDTKIASNKIKIVAEVNLFKIIKLGVEYILKNVDFTNAKESNTGYRSAATNTGYRSAATNTGDSSAATNTGYRSAATNTGYRSAATNTGYRSAATNTGDRSAATNTGDRSAATNTGYSSAATNTGDRSAATNTGYRSAATNTGDGSAATNTGYRSAATNTGYRSAATNTGYSSAAIVEGKNSTACGLGIENKCKGAVGCWLVLTEWVEDENSEWQLKEVKSIKVDGKKVKGNTFYSLIKGKVVEVE